MQNFLKINIIFSKNSALMTSFYEFCNSNSSNCRGNRQANNCFHYDRGLFQDIGDFFRTFPPLSFQLDQEAVYTWDPEDYLFKDVYDRYCLPFNELP